MKSLLVILAACMMISMTACVSTAPRSFKQTRSLGWTALEVRDGLQYDRAWNTAFDLLVMHFDIDKAYRNEGYVRTEWLHTWSGTYQATYRVRVTLKFSPDKKVLRFKPEAQTLISGYWIPGVDSRLVSTLKTDLSGTIGRVAQ